MTKGCFERTLACGPHLGRAISLLCLTKVSETNRTILTNHIISGNDTKAI